MRVAHLLNRIVTQELSKLVDRDAPALVRIASQPQFGHYQADGVMAQAKRERCNPRELAEKLVAKLIENPELERKIGLPQVAGPGFINLTLTDEYLLPAIKKMASDERLDVDRVEQPRTVVVDYSSPNAAKPLHVGHLRSTILGDAIVRVLDFLGHRVIRDNHVGDWGTQFGMLLVGFRRWGDAQALEEKPTDELERVYQLTNAAAKEDEAVADEARAELAKLQAGDADNRALWEDFVSHSRGEIQQTYRRLGVLLTEEDWRGESMYHDMLGPLVRELEQDGIAREDEGALLVYYGEGDDPRLAGKPFMIRKSDGAFNYATTDLATIRYRREQFGADEMVYAVDKRQNLHFRQLFAAAKKIGWKNKFVHVSFGAILGPDGRPIKTREGGSVRLADLLTEAVERAQTIIEEKNPGLDAAEKQSVARMVGIGAVKYADLSQNRNSDYRFDWDKLLAFDGNTAPYLQYVYARTQSIFRKRDKPDWSPPADAELAFSHEAERNLAVVLLRFGDIVHEVTDDYLPHLLSDHLFQLAQTFNAFYRDCPVLSSEGFVLLTRLTLCRLTVRQIELGLQLLGISTPERM